MYRNSARLGPLPRRRGVAAVAALGALLAGMLAGCGTSGNSVSGGSVTASPSVAATSSAAATPAGSASATVGDQLADDVGYFRSGGIAGFSDQLTVSPDGIAVLQRHGAEIVRCKVKPEPLSQLAQLQAVAATTIPSPSSGPRRMPPSHADMMTVGLVINGTRVPSSQLGPSPSGRQLFERMSSLFEDAVALSPGSTPSPNTSASMCDPI
jgi:hypothetical protein